MYIDKLDGSISQEFFNRKSEEWRTEQTSIMSNIEKHQNVNQNYLDDGLKLLELSQRAVNLYDRQTMVEKRRLLDYVVSNSTWKNGKLTPQYRQPFDLIAVTNHSYQKKKVANSEISDLRPIWLPSPDSNQGHGG